MPDFEVHIAVTATVPIVLEAADADAAADAAEDEFFENYSQYMSGINAKACSVEEVVSLDDEDEDGEE